MNKTQHVKRLLGIVNAISVGRDRAGDVRLSMEDLRAEGAVIVAAVLRDLSDQPFPVQIAAVRRRFNFRIIDLQRTRKSYQGIYSGAQEDTERALDGYVGEDRDPEREYFARDLYKRIYDRLSSAHRGLFDAMTSAQPYELADIMEEHGFDYHRAGVFRRALRATARKIHEEYTNV